MAIPVLVALLFWRQKERVGIAAWAAWQAARPQPAEAAEPAAEPPPATGRTR